MSKPTTPAARREAQATIEAMREALNTTCIEIYFSAGNGKWEIVWGDKDEQFVVADSLDDAFIEALHVIAGTEEAPF